MSTWVHFKILILIVSHTEVAPRVGIGTSVGGGAYSAGGGASFWDKEPLQFSILGSSARDQHPMGLALATGPQSCQERVDPAWPRSRPTVRRNESLMEN